MTRIEELEQILNETAEKFNKEINKFKAEIEHIKALAELKESKKEGKWEPKEGDEIWFRNMTGKASYLYYQEGIDIKSNLVFPTKEECERYWHFMDTVKEKSYEFSKEEWEDDRINKYFIKYFYADKAWFTHCTLRLRSFGEIYFKNEESAQYIIDNFKDELMEYWI